MSTEREKILDELVAESQALGFYDTINYREVLIWMIGQMSEHDITQLENKIFMTHMGELGKELMSDESKKRWEEFLAIVEKHYPSYRG